MGRTPPPIIGAMPERKRFFSIDPFPKYDKYQSLRQIQKRKEIKADNEHEISGVRNLGISSNDYLVWLVHKPAADQVSYVIKVRPQYIHS